MNGLIMQREVTGPGAWGEQGGPVEEIIGTSAAVRRARELIRKLGPTEECVLIQGETGTGKELIARALHAASRRARGPFVAINCAALQDTLLLSELFGHEKGAFTSADRAKPGLFETAHGGALFIDEVGEMAPAAQVKLLRVLEDGRVRRVGAVTWKQTNVRVIAATNRDLAKEAAAGRFRPDLYYRLNVLGIKTVPLRDRPEDVPLLAEHFLRQGPAGGPTGIDLPAMRALLAYRWPGNVRELRNAMKRALALAEGPEVTLDDLPEEVRASGPGAPGALPPPPRAVGLDEAEKQYLLGALSSNGWNKARAARQLGISRHRLFRLMHKYSLRRDG
jgi:DNA-binding NtrC family response regulator